MASSWGSVEGGLAVYHPSDRPKQLGPLDEETGSGTAGLGTARNEVGKPELRGGEGRMRGLRGEQDLSGSPRGKNRHDGSLFTGRVVLSDVLGGKDVVEGRDGRTDGWSVLSIRYRT
jgi:hypothetical protein